MIRPIASASDFDILDLYQNNAKIHDYINDQPPAQAVAGMALTLSIKLSVATDVIDAISLIRNMDPPPPTSTVIPFPPSAETDAVFSDSEVIAQGNLQKFRISYTKGDEDLELDLSLNVNANMFANAKATVASAIIESGDGLSIVGAVSGSSILVIIGHFPGVVLWINDKSKLGVLSLLKPLKWNGSSYVRDPRYPNLVGTEKTKENLVYVSFEFPRGYRPTHVAFLFTREEDPNIGVKTDKQNPVALTYFP